jgi:hypothetical protein
MNKKTYNVLKPREYTNGNGEVKRGFNRLTDPKATMTASPLPCCPLRA